MCTVVALCSIPTDPSNGMVTFTGVSVGDDATYTCNVGFELIGPEVTTCTPDMGDDSSASFLPDAPICSRELKH